MFRARMSRCASTFLKTARGWCCSVSRKLRPLVSSRWIEVLPPMSVLRISRHILLPAFLFSRLAFGKETAPAEFVDIKSVDKTIVIDLRYASANNVAHRPLYPLGTHALVRASVAKRLVIAQKYLRGKGYGLKIWDAYRSQSAQEQLFRIT